jgi:abhydrolase domain-containing protein 5
VKHLILADPWGFPERPVDVAQRYNVPLWIRAIVFVSQPFNPLWPVRVAGPFGKQKNKVVIMKCYLMFYMAE